MSKCDFSCSIPVDGAADLRGPAVRHDRTPSPQHGGFWGATPDSVVYDIGVLLSYPHEYMNVDHDSEAWQHLHALFMRTLPFDPFEVADVVSSTDSE